MQHRWLGFLGVGDQDGSGLLGILEWNKVGEESERLSEKMSRDLEGEVKVWFVWKRMGAL